MSQIFQAERLNYTSDSDDLSLCFLMFIDSHAHIDGEEFDADRDEVVARAREAGVRAILNVGTGDPHGGELERAVAVAERYEGVYAAVGRAPARRASV